MKGTIDEIIFSKKDDECRGIGLSFDEFDECAVLMRFMDGEAIEVGMDGRDIPAEKDPIILSYPKKKELSRDMREEIREYTGRSNIVPFDVALKYGKPNRLSGKTYLY